MVIFQCRTDLQALVGFVDLQNLNLWSVTARGAQSLGDLLECVELVPSCNQDQLGWLTCQYTLQRRAKLLECIVNSGQNDGHIR